MIPIIIFGLITVVAGFSFGSSIRESTDGEAKLSGWSWIWFIVIVTSALCIWFFNNQEGGLSLYDY